MDGRIQIGTQQVRHHNIELERIQFPSLHRNRHQEIHELKMTSIKKHSACILTTSYLRYETVN